jgi:hypothetical protein
MLEVFFDFHPSVRAVCPVPRVKDRRVISKGIPKFLPIQVVKRGDEFREEPVDSFLLFFGRARLRHQ